MRMMSKKSTAVLLATCFVATAQAEAKEKVLPPINQRYAGANGDEVPDFQRHVTPLMGRLGCNGRACHGSFQGRGGFRLSLFGYDFKADHKALLEDGTDRVDVDDPVNSLIIVKPTDDSQHEGGKRYDKDSWEYNVLLRWIEGGAKIKEIAKLEKLEILPSEIVFDKTNQKVQIQCIAVWADGTREDVTPLCRFKSNDDMVAAVDTEGMVTSAEPGDTHLIVSYDNAVVPVPAMQPVSSLTGKNYPQVSTPTKVDELVVQKLRKLGIVPSELCTDADFLRRVHLDMTGTLPTAEEVKAFLADKNPNKRAKKIDELLETPAYAAWWTTKLCDYTGNNDTQLNNASPMRGRAVQEWYDWIYKRVAENQPYDELVEGIACASSIKPGQSYTQYCKQMSDIYRPDSDKSFADLDNMTYYWARQDFREIEARAIGFAYSFMGIRIQCAQCHKHPFDTWSKDDFHQFKNFFARVMSGRNAPREYRDEYNKLVNALGLKGKRGNEVRRMLPDLLKDGKTVPFPATYNSDRLQRTRNPMGEYPVFDHAKLLGGEVVDVENVDEPRQVLMDWLRQKDNPYFARAFVNRVWASYFNVGIVDPPDDLSLGNPPSNKALLDYLADGFIESGFDMKWVHRTIANSRTYQLSWKPNESNRSDLHNFSHAIPRRLPAEVAYDAVQFATSDDEQVAKMDKDAEGRAISIPGANYRNRNRAGSAAYALQVFGRSTRDTNCDCDRSDEPTLLQTVYLQNDRDTLQLLDAKRGTWLNQVAQQLNPQRADKAGARTYDARQIARFRKQLNIEVQQLARLKKKGADKATIAKLEARIKYRRRRLAEVARSKPEAKAEKVEVAEAKVEELVNQAYLRTLSRYPSEDELARSVGYVQEADDTVNGVRDVLWALINTKEFIVNH